MSDLFNPELLEPFQAVYKGFNENAGGHQIEAAAEQSASLLLELARNPIFWFDYLVSITATHSAVDPTEFCIHYHLASITKSLSCHVFIKLHEKEGQKPGILSSSHIWKTAEWHERECAELFGINFENHPDLRNLLLPADWLGFPLRKNYKPAPSYHGLQIAYSSN